MGGNEVVEGRLRGLVASLERPVEDAGARALRTRAVASSDSVRKRTYASRRDRRCSDARWSARASRASRSCCSLCWLTLRRVSQEVTAEARRDAVRVATAVMMATTTVSVMAASSARPRRREETGQPPAVNSSMASRGRTARSTGPRVR